VIQPGEQSFVPLSPAQAAAATVSSLVEADDPVERLVQLGGLFSRVPAFGLWNYSDTKVTDFVARARAADGSTPPAHEDRDRVLAPTDGVVR